LSLWVSNAEAAELDFQLHLPTALRSRVRSAKAIRQKAVRAQEEAQTALASAAKELTNTFGLSVRDTADLMGLSHQRIQQLVAEVRLDTGTVRRRAQPAAQARDRSERAAG
jgi:hypothetical protein